MIRADFIKNTFCHFRKCYVDGFYLTKTSFPKILFRLREPSKKLGHVVRIILVQFSASELHEVSSYDRLKVEKVKIRILRRQHLLGSIDSTDSIESIDFIDSIDSILLPHKRPPTFTPHTKGRSLRSRKQQYRWGRRMWRRTHQYCCFALCDNVNVGGLCLARIWNQ